MFSGAILVSEGCLRWYIGLCRPLKDWIPPLKSLAPLHIVSSLWDVQIDRILHTLIRVCIIVFLQSVGLLYLGMVTCWWLIPRSLLPVAWYGLSKFYHY